MALHNSGDWWMDTYNQEPAGRVIICIHTPIPKLCDAIQITGQMPSRFYKQCKFKYQHISLKFIYNVTLIWSPGFVRRWSLWCFESRARAAVARAAIFIVCDVFKMRERHHGQMKNEIMNGNQGDHVTFVWSWRRSKQRLSFCRTFHPFIQNYNADAVHRRTLRSPDVTLLTQAGWYGLSGFEFPVAGHLCDKNVTHACLFAKFYNPCNAPALWKTSQVWVSSAARQERPSMFFNFTKMILINIWILN